jgi:hypothetical protein
MQDARCKMQDARCKMQDARCKMQDARCKMQVTGFKGLSALGQARIALNLEP